MFPPNVHPHIGSGSWDNFFHVQSGGGFTGYHYQRGGLGLGSLFSGLLKTVLPVAKSAGKAIAKQALSTGLNVASDVIEGRDPKQSLEQHGRQATAQLIRQGQRRLAGISTPSTKRRRPTGKVYKKSRQRGGKRLGYFTAKSKSLRPLTVKGKHKSDIFD